MPDVVVKSRCEWMSDLFMKEKEGSKHEDAGKSKSFSMLIRHAACDWKESSSGGRKSLRVKAFDFLEISYSLSLLMSPWLFEHPEETRHLEACCILRLLFLLDGRVKCCERRSTFLIHCVDRMHYLQVAMASVHYVNHVLDIISDSHDLRKTVAGIARQTGYAAGGAVAGGIIGGPAGALVGTVVGAVLGYTRADPYDVSFLSFSTFIFRHLC